MIKWNKYKCYYYDWWKNKNNVWIYEVIEQWKVKFKMQKISWWTHWIDKDWFITINYELTSKRVKDWELQEKPNKNWITCWDETEFAVYCNRQWTPFIFKKLDNV
jgi:hypothetical protein